MDFKLLSLYYGDFPNRKLNCFFLCWRRIKICLQRTKATIVLCFSSRFRMRSKSILQITLILATVFKSLSTQSIEIVRKSDQEGDVFRVPSALLTTSRCLKYGARVLKCDSNSCLCQCTWPQATLIMRSGKLECIGDEFIRTREGKCESILTL